MDKIIGDLNNWEGIQIKTSISVDLILSFRIKTYSDIFITF